VCSHCDRGQRYCCRTCSAAARRLSLRDAGCRYQNTRRGRLAHPKRHDGSDVHVAYLDGARIGDWLTGGSVGLQDGLGGSNQVEPVLLDDAWDWASRAARRALEALVRA
jgi:hypothetical protein